MTTALATSVLATTGSDIAPWLIGAGIIIVLGAIVLIIARVVRARRARGTAEPAATDAGSDPISPDDSR